MSLPNFGLVKIRKAHVYYFEAEYKVERQQVSIVQDWWLRLQINQD